MPDFTPMRPDIVTPVPGIVPGIPEVPKDPHSGALILNPDGSKHIGDTGATMLHDKRADPCCEGGGIIPECAYVCYPDEAPRIFRATVSGIVPCFAQRCCLGDVWVRLTGSPPEGQFLIPYYSPIGAGCMWCAPVSPMSYEYKRYPQGSNCSGAVSDQCAVGMLYLRIYVGFPPGYNMQVLITFTDCEGYDPCTLGQYVFQGLVRYPDWLGCNHAYTLTNVYACDSSCTVLCAGGAVTIEPVY